MLLIAYGKTQSDTLQLHLPELCYPAFGFTIAESQPARFDLGHGVVVPGRNLVATSPGREERISYWTRIGEYLPTSNTEQRKMKFRIALSGVIPDGVLVRISNMRGDDAEGFGLNERFAADLLNAVAPVVRPALITTEKAHRMAAVAKA
jgi:EpsI family protein